MDVCCIVSGITWGCADDEGPLLYHRYVLGHDPNQCVIIFVLSVGNTSGCRMRVLSCSVVGLFCWWWRLGTNWEKIKIKSFLAETLLFYFIIYRDTSGYVIEASFGVVDET